MIPEDTKGNRTGPNIEARCKTGTGISADVMLISVFRSLCPAMLDSSGKTLVKFDSVFNYPDSSWRYHHLAVWVKNHQRSLE